MADKSQSVPLLSQVFKIELSIATKLGQGGAILILRNLC
jgi:hypothetical protein